MTNKKDSKNIHVDSKKIGETFSGNKPYFEQIFDSRSEAILILDEKNEIVNVNKGFEKMFQFSLNEAIGRTPYDIIVPDKLVAESKDILDTLNNGLNINKETTGKRKDGHLINVLITGNRLNLDNNLHGKYLIYTDISGHKKSEEQIKASLMEKEVLLKEIHHRVKNNLQVVSSLLYLQSRKITDKDVESMFLNCQNRVKSISLIHEKLYQTNDLARIDFDKYIKSLVYHLFNSFGVKSEQVGLTVNSENIFLTMDTAIPCGLIINELVTNILKHAFPSNRKGEIKIEVSYHRNNKFTLLVADNGIGLPVDIDIENTDTLGFQLVQTLIKQLEASLEINRENGTEYIISFSILNQKGGGE
ncbi:MAG: sensor histidine kinase [Ignavibacteria bacterium]